MHYYLLLTKINQLWGGNRNWATLHTTSLLIISYNPPKSFISYAAVLST